MDKLDMFQARFGKLYEFFWWDIKIIQTNSGLQLTSNEFQEGISVLGLRLTLVSPDHQEING